MTNLSEEINNMVNEEDEKPRLSDFLFDEDGYSEEMPMLCGYTDKDGVLHSTFRFREMGGSDEETINNPAIRKNGGKVINTVLSRCIVSIGTIQKKNTPVSEWNGIISSLYTGDQDIMTLRIREGSIGKEIEVKHNCPDEECHAKLTTFLSTDEITIVPFKGTEKIQFELKRGLTTRNNGVIKAGHVRLPNGADREALVPVALKNSSKASTLLLSRAVKLEGYDLPVTEDMMRSLTVGDRKILGDILEENSFGMKFELQTECNVCGCPITLNMGQINFL